MTLLGDSGEFLMSKGVNKKIALVGSIPFTLGSLFLRRPVGTFIQYYQKSTLSQHLSEL
jgi:hypothetical protein